MAFCLVKGGILQGGRWPLGGREVVFCAAVESVWISVFTNLGFSTGAGGGGLCRWISTGLLRENYQVFNSFMTEKNINLLILQSTPVLLITYVNG